jgi:serine/threonine protein kinase
MLTGKQFGRYEIRNKIGEGGMGEVYAAHDSELDRSVAIKLLPFEFVSDDDRRSRFRQEARTASSLNHPNIITIYEIGENEHGSFLATELIEGRTLREILKSESISLPRILRIVEQTANALVAAHNARIVHRDIKPENIMVRKDSIVKVLDFGLAKPTGVFGVDDNGESAKTIPGTVMGSARYMSPEQARGLAVDERTDIWSLGVVLYEMLVGTAPFKGETTADTIAAVIYHEPEPINEVLPNVPQELVRILRKALQKDREERYQSVKDFALDIKDLLYEFEHTNSGNRSSHTTSSPDFSENPTIIQKSVSAGHSTRTTYGTTSDVTGTVQLKQKTKLMRSAAIALGVVVPSALFALLASGYHNWFASSGRLVTTAFDRSQISRISTDGKVLLPAISPDGKYTAYVSGEVGNQSLVVRQISTDSMVTVVPPTNLNFSAVVFSPSGDRIYYCQTRSDFSVNTLYTVPTLGGPPKKLIEDVDSTVTFSPDGKRFAFMRHTTNNSEDIIFTVNTATLETDELIRSKQTGYDFFSARPAWSPDGKTILLGAGKRASGFISDMAVSEISIADKTFKLLNTNKFYTVGSFVWFADGSGFVCAARETQASPVQVWRSTYPNIDFKQVTNDFNDYMEVGLAADGKTILTLEGDTSSSLWLYAPATKESVQVTPESRDSAGFFGLSQRKDGSLLFSHKQAKDVVLWAADKDGKSGKPLLEGSGSSFAPVTTPDGRYIVFNLQKDKTSRIWRTDADGKNPIQLTENDPSVADFSPQVTPDSKMIIFQRQVSSEDRVSLMKVSIDGGKAEPFHASEGWSIFQPRISPDGKKIAYSTYDINTFVKKLQIASLEGSNFGKVEANIEFNLINQVTWSPDSKELTILTSRSGIPNIWRQPIDGSAPTPITGFKSGRIFNFAWAADGKSLLMARGNTVNDLILIRDIAPEAGHDDGAKLRQKSLTGRG